MNNDILPINQVAGSYRIDRSPGDDWIRAQDVIENLISRRPTSGQMAKLGNNLALDIAYTIRDTHLFWSSLI